MARSDSELFKDKIEVSLDSRQVFYLFFGGAVLATLVFVLGVMVGRRVESRSLVAERSLARDPLAALDHMQGTDELVFPTALRGEGEGIPKLNAPPSPAPKPQPLLAGKAVEIGKAPKQRTPEPAVAPVSAPETKTSKPFTLQVGSFQDKQEADTYFRKLAMTEYQPYMVEAEVPGKGKYYRVRVGRFGNFEEALAAKSQFEDSQHIIAYVTRIKR